MKYSLFLIAISLIASCGGNRKLLCASGSSDPQCLITVQPPTQPPTQPPAAQLSCSITASKSTALHAESISLNVSVTGGNAPYKVTTSTGNFASTTAVSVSFANSGTSDRVVNYVLHVADSAGAITSCNVFITVRPQDSSNGLGCSISPARENISVGQEIEFTVTASGATDANFSNLEIQSGWSVPLTRQSGTVAKTVLQFANPGTRNLTTRVSAAGAEANCSKQIVVTRPSLQVVLNPSSSVVPIGTVLSVRAIASGFDSALPLSYSFETLEPGISITLSGDTAQVRVTDGRFHRFDLRVRAFNSAGASTQTVLVPVQFSSNVILTCEIQAGAITRDGTIPFFVAPLNSSVVGDVLAIDEFLPGPGAVKTSLGITNPMSFRFSGTGFQTVFARARSLVTGTPCFDGAPFSLTIRLRESLNRCDIVMSPNPSVAGAEVLARVNIPANSGSGNFRMDLTANNASVRPGNTFGEFFVRFPVGGNYPVSAQVIDISTGGLNSYPVSITCGTTQTVASLYETRYVDCSSSSYRYRQCGVGSGVIEAISVNRRYSSSGCSQGYSFGVIAPNTIWVDHGCRASFEVRVRVN